MNTHAEKAQKAKSKTASVSNSDKQSSSQAMQFQDNRPQVLAQMKMQEMANESIGVHQLQVIQRMPSEPIQLVKSKKQRAEAKAAKAAASEARKAEKAELDDEEYATARAGSKKGAEAVEAARIESAKEGYSVKARMAHILNRHRHGQNQSGKTEFPAEWNDAMIEQAVTVVCMNAPSISIDPKYGPYLSGFFKGVKIEVYFDKDEYDDYETLSVSTAYPMVDPPKFVKNP